MGNRHPRARSRERGLGAGVGDPAGPDGGDHRVGQLAPVPGVVPGQRCRRGTVDDGPRGRVHQDQVRRLTDGERSTLPASRAMRAGANDIRSATFAPVQPAGVDHGLDHHRQRGLQAEHAGRGFDEGVLLVVAGVRGVVGADRVDGAVGQCLPQRGHVLVGPQRRIHLVGRVVASTSLGGQHQVVRGDLGRDVDAALLGPADARPRSRRWRRGRRAPANR